MTRFAAIVMTLAACQAGVHSTSQPVEQGDDSDQDEAPVPGLAGTVTIAGCTPAAGDLSIVAATADPHVFRFRFTGVRRDRV